MKIKILLIGLIFSTNLFSQVPSGNVLYLDCDGDFVQLFENIITTKTFTIEACANMFGLGGGYWHQNPIFEQRNNSSGYGSATIVLATENHSGYTTLNNRSSEGDLDAAFYPRPPYSEWHHYAGVVDHESIYLYIDGQLVEKGPNTQSGDYVTAIDYVHIGRIRYLNRNNGFFNGVIDELRIWDHARTINQINETKNDTLGPEYYKNPQSGLVGYWRFDTIKSRNIGGNIIDGVQDLSIQGHFGSFEEDAELIPALSIHKLKPFYLLEPQNGASIPATNVTLKWQQASNKPNVKPGVICYNIYYDNNSDFTTPETIKVDNDTSITIENLKAGTTYFWKVLAKNTIGDSLWSENTNSFIITPANFNIPAGNVLYLDGDGDFVQLFENIITTKIFTIEAYANMFGLGGGYWHQNPIFQQRSDFTNYGSPLIVLFAENQSEHTSFNSKSSIGPFDAILYPHPPYSEWHHYAGIVDHENIYLYIDGKLVKQALNNQSGNYSSSIDYVEIGRHRCVQVNSGYFYGGIDELRIWDHARTINQINETKNDTLGSEYYKNPQSGLVGYWRFDTIKRKNISGNIVDGVQDLSIQGHFGSFEDDAKLISARPLIHTLRSFLLLEPAMDASIKTTCPNLIWQQASDEQVFYPGEMRYKIYHDKNFEFTSPEIKEVNNDTSVILENLTPGTTYFWKVLAKNIVSDILWCENINAFFVRYDATGIESNNQSQPEQFKLYQNYPNPFNPVTTIQYDVPKIEMVTLKIYNLQSQLICELVNERQQAGSYTVIWDARDKATGIYLVELKAGLVRQVIKMTVLK